jgi:hypothetical protein
MNDFYTNALARMAPPEPVMPAANEAAYRAHRRLTSASQIYAEPAPLAEQRAARRPSIYSDRPQKTLADYQSDRVSRWEWHQEQESAVAYRGRLRQGGLLAADDTLRPENMGLISAADRDAVIRGVVAVEALEAQSAADAYAAQRELLARRTYLGSGEQQLGHRGIGHGSRQIDHLGHLSPEPLSGARPASRSDVAAALAASEDGRMGTVASRTPIPGGSSGTGWVVGR